MDKFEYALLSLTFVDTQDGGSVVTSGFVELNIYKSDGISLGAASYTRSLLDGSFVKLTKSGGASDDRNIWLRDAVCVPDKYPLLSMAPFLSMLGVHGWHVIDTKVNSWPAYGQILLERKIEEGLS